METGKAAVWKGKYDIEVQTLPIPEVKDDGMLIQVEAAGVCGTDGHLIQQNPPYPAIMCHEFAGKIIAMGRNANQKINTYGGPLKTGDRIVVYPWITCGKCEGCRTFRPGTCTTCNNSFVYGIPYSQLGLEGAEEPISSSIEYFPYFKGGFAEYVYIFPETYLWKIPDDMPSEIASLLDPLAVAVRAMELTSTSPGVLEEAMTTSAKIVVIGAGPVGLLTALVSRLMGAEQVIIIGKASNKKRLQLSKEIAQVDEVICSDEYDSQSLIKKVKHLTTGGADVVFDCANTISAFTDGLEMIRRMGTLVEVGNMVNQGQTVSFDPARLICSKHARVMGMSANHPGAFDKAFHILKRHHQIPFRKLFTHTCNLESLLDTLKKMHDPDYMKGLMIPRK
jgi:threonine dehydrogenase-like Zn-dependent dehydrogenase